MRVFFTAILCIFLTTTIVHAQDFIENDSLAISLDTLLLDELVVTAQRPLVKVELDKITYNMADDPESPTNNLLDMLKKVPMVTVDGEENVQLKGSANFKFYMNGKPSTLISNNPKAVLRSIPAHTIKNIEVITNPGAKYDAEGVNGIINIVTQSTSSMSGYTVSLSGGGDTRGTYNGGTYFSLKYGKIGLTGNFDYYDLHPPKNNMHSLREDLLTHTMLTQEGGRSNHAHGVYGYGELSYEIDTFNLVNLAYDKYGGDYNSDLHQIVRMSKDNEMIYQYNRMTHNTKDFGNTAFRVDYQRTFPVKDRLLTASYLLNIDPDDSRSDTRITDAYHFDEGRNKQYSNASTREHTFQLDYTTPIADIHTVESGVKYIRRINASDSRKFLLSGTDWMPIASDADAFEHVQHVLAAYAGYSLKYNQWGFKAGLRYETIWLQAEFPMNRQENFDIHYANFIPSAVVTYSPRPGQTWKTGYNMRIQRPGIRYLNPYVNTTDTSYIYSGNPDLDAVKYHNVNLNYNFYAPKINIAVDFTYNFTHNGIEELTWLEKDVSHSSYFNVAKNNTWSLSAYLNWTVTSKWTIYSNLGGNYSTIEANNDSGLSNSGFSGNAYGGVQYTIPWNVRLGLNGYYSNPRITLQGESSGYYFWGFSASKSFLDNKLNVRLHVDDLLFPIMKVSGKQSTPAFSYETNNSQYLRRLGISVSYRFGEMKTQIKKARRSIRNDDNMSGGGQNSGISGGQPQSGEQ
jgi:outer membrane cobalamin receptor